jgi:LacI family transcriptional regulator
MQHPGRHTSITLRPGYASHFMSKIPTKVTIREVAALAGVSVMTVSRVMRNEPQVALATREAVRQAIDALQYVPLQSARNLSSSVAKVVGLVVMHMPKEAAARAGYEYLSSLHLGALTVCNARDYGLMLIQVEGAACADRLVRMARARQIGGFIIAAPATEVPGLVQKLCDANVTHATLGALTAAPSMNWVAADERAAAAELTTHVASMGHRDIAFVGGNAPIRACRERLAGFTEAMRRLKIPVKKEWLLKSGITFEAGVEAGRRLLSAAPTPSAVVCITDDLAAGILAAAHEMGWRLPEQLSVVGFDDFGLARKTWPPLTTAHLPSEEMAAHAAAQVIATLEGQSLQSRILPCPVHLRQSVGVWPSPKVAGRTSSSPRVFDSSVFDPSTTR